MLHLSSAITQILMYLVTCAALISVVLYVCAAWAQTSLKHKMGILLEQGMTRSEARADIKRKPRPWELILLVYITYRRLEAHYVDEFMKRFSAKHFGTKPE